jgi:threonine/homoserine/homoserine lactone efflux protein
MRGVVAAAAGPGRTAAGWGTGTAPPTLSQVGTLVGFFPVAIALTLTPGVATALVIRSALRGGRRAAFATTLGNSAGVLAWALAAAVGIAAIVAASVTAFTVVKIAGAVVLLVMGLRSLLAKHETPAILEPQQRSAFRDGFVTSVANPKLAVFFVALFPQFVPEHHAVLPLAVAMAAVIVALDIVWYSTLAWLVSRARTAFTSGPWLRRTQRLTGCVLIGLGARLALERR